MQRNVFLCAVPPILAELFDLLSFFDEESFYGLLAIHGEVLGVAEFVGLDGTCADFNDFFHVEKKVLLFI